MRETETGPETVKKALFAAKINLRNTKSAFVATAICFGVMFLQTLVKTVLAVTESVDMSTNLEISCGSILYLLPFLCAILIPARNFRKFINLGGKRESFFRGCVCAYILLALTVSLANIIIYYAYDQLVMRLNVLEGVVNLLDVFGWSSRGPVVAFGQQSAFLFFMASFLHTLVSLHDTWIGWAVDGVIIAIISVFTPIEPLRNLEAAFFRLILFGQNAVPQILACLVLGAAFCALGRTLVSRRKI